MKKILSSTLLVLLVLSLHAQNASKALFFIKQKGKYGFIDKTGKIIIKPIYDYCRQDFSEGMAAVQLKGKWGYINATGKMIIPPQFEDVGDFSDGMAIIVKDGKYGYINKTGKIVIQPNYEVAGTFFNGITYIAQNNKYEFVDKTGKKINDTPFDGIYFENKTRYAAIKVGDNWGYFDSKKRAVCIQPIFTRAGRFAEDLAFVKTENESGYIDSTGNFIIKLDFKKNEIGGDFSEGIAVIKTETKQYGFINKKGEFLNKKLYKPLSEYHDGLLAIHEGTELKFINKEEETVIQLSNIVAYSDFYNGVAVVKENSGFCGLIDKTGKYVIKAECKSLTPFLNELARVSLGGKTGYLNKKGQYVWPLTE